MANFLPNLAATVCLFAEDRCRLSSIHNDSSNEALAIRPYASTSTQIGSDVARRHASRNGLLRSRKEARADIFRDALIQPLPVLAALRL